MFKKLTALAMAAFLLAAFIPTASVLVPSEAYASSYNKPPPVKKDTQKVKPAKKSIKKDAIKKGGVSGIKLKNSSKNGSKFKPNHTTKNKSSGISLKKESSRRLEFLRGKSDTKNLNVTKGVDNLFKAGRTPKASELTKYAEQQGWKPSQAANGPLKYIDENGINRLTIKQGSSRAPGSENPHVELRDASGRRVDPAGNPVTRKGLGNHTPIDFDL